MTAFSSRAIAKTGRFNIRATRQQQKLIRTGAKASGVSVTDFILTSACLQAEHALADKRDFVVSAKQWQAFVDALEEPAKVIPELAELFAGRRSLPGGAGK